jgi:probable HAF family extracellular repeat protein
MDRTGLTLSTAIRRLTTLLLVGLISLSGVAHAGARQDDGPPRYKLIPIGTIKDYPSTSAAAMNAEGVVVGAAANFQNSTFRAVTFKPGSKLKALIKGEKNPQSFATDINAQGQILIETAVDGTISVLLWESGEGTPIAIPNRDVRARAINDSGLVVGSITSFEGDYSLRPYTWHDGEFTELELLENGVHGQATNVNADGLVVGQVELAEQDGGWQPQHAVAWIDGEIVDLGTVAGHFSMAVAVNASGQIVGTSTTEEGQGIIHMSAALWEDGEVTALGTLGDDVTSQALAINAQGDIVGSSNSVDGNEAVLWHDGEIYDLNELVEDAGDVKLVAAGDINDDGLILAVALTPTGGGLSYLLEPIES